MFVHWLPSLDGAVLNLHDLELDIPGWAFEIACHPPAVHPIPAQPLKGKASQRGNHRLMCLDSISE